MYARKLGRAYSSGSRNIAIKWRIGTDKSGRSTDRQVAFLGVYPAVIKTKLWKCDGRHYNLPVEVESKSFEASESAKELDARYLAPLNLERSTVLLFDMMPYYYASTSVSGEEKRSMWKNVQRYEQAEGVRTAVQERPKPDSLIAECQRMPGNMDRLRSIVASAKSLELLLTLGSEAAAFILGMDRAKNAKAHLYKAAVFHDVLGRSLRVVHLAHPGILMKNASWREKHSKWVKASGQQLIATMG